MSDTAVSAHPSAFLTLGDNENGFPPSYNGGGKLSDYQNVYGPTFGRLNSVVYPEVGNGDFTTSTSTDDSGFMTYFTDAGVFSRIRQDGGDNSNLSNMYYSFNLGHWHIIALNTECVAVPATSLGGKGCGAGSGEDNWLKADLAAHPGMCTLAYWHHPVFNSSSQGTGNNISNLWSDLYNAHADVVLNAHGNNHYERFVPMNASGSPDSAGPTEFIVSNGGYSHGDPNGPSSTTAAGGGPNFTSFGVLQLTLHPQSYTWQFLNAYDSSTTPFSDSGSRSCHSG